MSKESVLLVDDYCVLLMFYAIDSDLFALFRSPEITDERKARVEEEEEQEPAPTVQAAAPTHVIRDRLDIMGFTMTAARNAFDNGMQLLQLPDCSERPFLEGYSFAKWQSILEEYKKYDGSNEDELSDLAAYFLMDQGTTRGFPPVDNRFLLRAVIDSCSPQSEVVYDFSDLVRGGLTVSLSDEPKSEYSRIGTEYLRCSPQRKMVVLTEGSSDAKILEAALSFFYPHLREFVSFMDFGSTRAQGGATWLVGTLKSFAAAGIANRIIAIFDNDAAGSDALRALRNVQLPHNVRWMQLPPIEFADNYPARSPSGRIEGVNANGTAASIEMYFGANVLSAIDNTLPHIHWNGYMDGVKKYQGEIVNKERYHEHFFSKLQSTEAGEQAELDQNWRDMRLVIDGILKVFV